MAPLTRREQEILRLLEMRRTNREIAELLSITVRMVECHVQGILAKLAAPNRRAAVAVSQTRPALFHYQGGAITR
jgi:LuxR family transcriptional regulator